jgi:hypothetical protein
VRERLRRSELQREVVLHEDLLGGRRLRRVEGWPDGVHRREVREEIGMDEKAAGDPPGVSGTRVK